MGTWGFGLFDGDGPLDLVADLGREIGHQLEALARQKPSPEVSGRISGTIGLLLQLAPDKLERAPLAKIIARHESQLAIATPKALAALEQIKGLTVDELERLEAPRTRRLNTALGHYLEHPRQPELFEHEEAEGMAQQLADRCGEILGEMWAPDRDIYNCCEDHMGALGVLLISEPWRLEEWRIDVWREALKSKHQAFVARGADEPVQNRKFFTAYMKRADLAFDLAIERASASIDSNG